MGRFLNADGYMATGQGFVGNNMFAYCLNDPVNCSDERGKSPEDPGAIAGQGLVMFLWELITGEEHPFRQQEAVNTQIQQEQLELVGNAINDARQTFWDVYKHRVELEVEAQYQRDMAVRKHWGYINSSTAVRGDFVAMTVANIGTYCTYVSLATAVSPTVGGVILLVSGIGCSIWTTLRYYGIIPEEGGNGA